MAKRKDFEKVMKADKNFSDIINDVSRDRIKNGLEKKWIGSREITRMATNSEHFFPLINDLKTKPRKKITL